MGRGSSPQGSSDCRAVPACLPACLPPCWLAGRPACVPAGWPAVPTCATCLHYCKCLCLPHTVVPVQLCLCSQPHTPLPIPIPPLLAPIRPSTCTPAHLHTCLQAPNLKTVWLEGNPLSPDTVAGLLAALPGAGVTALGLDEAQLARLPLAKRDALVQGAGSKLRVSGCVPGGPGVGYFKLERAPPEAAGTAGNGSSRPTTEVLVVSFGSAPSTPNWGGLLKKVRAAAVDPQEANFDVLYVVDPARAWYGGEERCVSVWDGGGGKAFCCGAGCCHQGGHGEEQCANCISTQPFPPLFTLGNGLPPAPS